MKAKGLHEVWSATDNSRLTSKQYSFRLPVHVAAKIQALCDLYPRRTRTEIVADLLAAALDELEAGFPSVKGPYYCDDDGGEPLFEDVGIVKRYHEYANGHYASLEKELGNEHSELLFDALVLIHASEASK